jgi:hypothetical protein
MQDITATSELLKSLDARVMRCYPVSTRINYVSNEDEECPRVGSAFKLRHYPRVVLLGVVASDC